MDMETKMRSDQAPSLQLAWESAHEKFSVYPPTEPQGTGVLHWLSRIASMIAALALLFTAVGTSYQFIEARADLCRFRLEGKVVNVGGSISIAPGKEVRR
jgi:hypothetical protein